MADSWERAKARQQFDGYKARLPKLVSGGVRDSLIHEGLHVAADGNWNDIIMKFIHDGAATGGRLPSRHAYGNWGEIFPEVGVAMSRGGDFLNRVGQGYQEGFTRAMRQIGRRSKHPGARIGGVRELSDQAGS